MEPNLVTTSPFYELTLSQVSNNYRSQHGPERGNEVVPQPV